MAVVTVRGRTVLPLGDLRAAGAVMLAAAAVQPLLPAGVGVPCPMRSLTGVPCPLCGMTTSVVATVQLRLGDAVAAAPAGIVATGLAVALLLARRRTSVTMPSWVLPAVLGVMWLYQLVRASII